MDLASKDIGELFLIGSGMGLLLTLIWVLVAGLRYRKNRNEEGAMETFKERLIFPAMSFLFSSGYFVCYLALKMIKRMEESMLEDKAESEFPMTLMILAALSMIGLATPGLKESGKKDENEGVENDEFS